MPARNVWLHTWNAENINEQRSVYLGAPARIHKPQLPANVQRQLRQHIQLKGQDRV